jgi:putative nucleotidyltransferase with HDIG domain
MSDSQSLAEKIVESIDSLPAMDPVITRVLSLVSDPNTSPRALAGVIRNDVSLTARILKLSNSAIFGLSRQVTSIEQAVLVLGFNEIRNLVIVSVTFDLMTLGDSKELFEKLWNHFISVSVIARFLCKKFTPDLIDVAYVAGLLHDIGKVPFAMRFPEEYTEIFKKVSEFPNQIHKLELEEFGCDHQEMGSLLLERWNIPDTIVSVTGKHHDMEEAVDDDLRINKLIELADFFSYVVMFNKVPEQEIDKMFINILGDGILWKEWITELQASLKEEFLTLAFA